jgi:hypothetical protein
MLSTPLRKRSRHWLQPKGVLRADPLGGQNLTLWGTTYRYPGAEPPAEPLDRAAILQQVERCIGLANRLLKRGKSKKG